MMMRDFHPPGAAQRGVLWILVWTIVAILPDTAKAIAVIAPLI